MLLTLQARVSCAKNSDERLYALNPALEYLDLMKIENSIRRLHGIVV